MDKDVLRILNESNDSEEFLNFADRYQFELSKALRGMIKDEDSLKISAHKPLSEEVFSIFGVYDNGKDKRNFEIVGNLGDKPIELNDSSTVPANSVLIDNWTGEDNILELNLNPSRFAAEIIHFLGLEIGEDSTINKNTADHILRQIKR